MANNIGVIRERTLASGERAFYLDFRPNGRVFTIPDPGGARPIPLRDRRTAERLLESIRTAFAEGKTLAAALAPYLSKPSAELLVERRISVWLDVMREEVEQTRRSPTTLRELERYAAEGGHFDYWRGRTIYEMTTGRIEDFGLWLGKRPSGRRKAAQGERISPKTVRNVLAALRSFHGWLRRRGDLDDSPARYADFPEIAIARFQPRRLTLAQQTAVLAAIPWERRGAFLAGAYEALRIGEIRAADLDDFDPETGILRVYRAMQGPRISAPRPHTKTRGAWERNVWHPELVRWLAWRMEGVKPEARLRGEALFWCPTARNAQKRWTPDPLEREWRAACERARVPYVPFQQGTRHTTLDELAKHLPERLLRAFSRHASERSLDHYVNPKPSAEVIRGAFGRRTGSA